VPPNDYMARLEKPILGNAVDGHLEGAVTNSERTRQEIIIKRRGAAWKFAGVDDFIDDVEADTKTHHDAEAVCGIVGQAFNADAIDRDICLMLAHEAQSVEEAANFQSEDGPTCGGRTRGSGDVNGEIGDVDVSSTKMIKLGHRQVVVFGRHSP
jgi:hypothetical protein